MEGMLYLIKRSANNMNCCYYAEHGEMGGVPDAIGYDTPCHARKFKTEEDAARFIYTELPAWGRTLHRPVGFTSVDFALDNLELATLLWYGIEVPERLLEPTAGRLRIWLR